MVPLQPHQKSRTQSEQVESRGEEFPYTEESPVDMHRLVQTFPGVVFLCLITHPGKHWPRLNILN